MAAGGGALYAVFDCKGAGTGFLAITDRRILFYNKEFMRRRKALTTVPFGKITSVSSVTRVAACSAPPANR